MGVSILTTKKKKCQSDFDMAKSVKAFTLKIEQIEKLSKMKHTQQHNTYCTEKRIESVGNSCRQEAVRMLTC